MLDLFDPVDWMEVAKEEEKVRREGIAGIERYMKKRLLKFEVGKWSRVFGFCLCLVAFACEAYFIAGTLDIEPAWYVSVPVAFSFIAFPILGLGLVSNASYPHSRQRLLDVKKKAIRLLNDVDVSENKYQWTFSAYPPMDEDENVVFHRPIKRVIELKGRRRARRGPRQIDLFEG